MYLYQTSIFLKLLYYNKDCNNVNLNLNLYAINNLSCMVCLDFTVNELFILLRKKKLSCFV